MKPDDRKGKLRVCKATDGLNHLQWGGRAPDMPFLPEDDFIIFPQEAEMKFIPKPGVFVIKFPDDPSRKLHVLGKDRHERALADLEQSLKQRLEAPVIRQHHLREQIDGDVQQLIGHLEGLVDERREKAQQKLIKRAETEAERFIKVLSDQRQRCRDVDQVLVGV